MLLNTLYIPWNTLTFPRTAIVKSHCNYSNLRLLICYMCWSINMAEKACKHNNNCPWLGTRWRWLSLCMEFYFFALLDNPEVHKVLLGILTIANWIGPSLFLIRLGLHYHLHMLLIVLLLFLRNHSTCGIFSINIECIKYMRGFYWWLNWVNIWDK